MTFRSRARCHALLPFPAALALIVSLSAPGSAQVTELRSGRPVRGTLAAGDTARYTMSVGTDHFVFGQVDQVSVDVAVRVLGPGGDVVLRASGLGRGSERFAGELKEAGTYTVEVNAEKDFWIRGRLIELPSHPETNDTVEDSRRERGLGWGAILLMAIAAALGFIVVSCFTTFCTIFSAAKFVHKSNISCSAFPVKLSGLRIRIF